MGDWNEFIKFIVVTEVVFSITVSLTMPFLPRIMQRVEKRKLTLVKNIR